MPQPAPQAGVIKTGTVAYATLKQRVEKAVAEAREAVAAADEVIANTRQRLQKAEETL